MCSRPPHSHRPNRPTRERQQRGGHQSVWLYGRHAALAALANADRRIERILATGGGGAPRRRPGQQGEVLSREIRRRLPAGAVHQGLAVLASPFEEPQLEDLLARCGDNALVLALDQVTDPHNVGAIVRSAAASGAAGVLVTERTHRPTPACWPRRRRAHSSSSAGARRQSRPRARATEGGRLLAVRPRREGRRRDQSSISPAVSASCWGPKARACAA